MSSPLKKMQKNAKKFEMNEIYRNMTPEQYKEGISRAVKNAVTELSLEYDKNFKKLQAEYNRSIQEGVMIAMDTLSVEILYELGRILDCYVDEPEFLDQKIDVVQNLYQTAMDSIKDYATKYKTDNQAQRVFEKKKKTIEKIFHIYGKDVK